MRDSEGRSPQRVVIDGAGAEYGSWAGKQLGQAGLLQQAHWSKQVQSRAAAMCRARRAAMHLTSVLTSTVVSMWCTLRMPEVKRRQI